MSTDNNKSEFYIYTIRKDDLEDYSLIGFPSSDSKKSRGPIQTMSYEGSFETINILKTIVVC